MLSRKLTRVFIIGVATVIITPLVAVSGWVSAASASGVVSITTPACGAVIFPSAAAGSWVIPGIGVDAYSNGPSDEGSGTDCSSTVSVVKGISAGEEWQCVEFINRLYLTNGWTDINWPGSAGATFYDDAPSNLKKQANGSVSYLGPGDVVIVNVFDNGVADGGHALVVNDNSDVTSGTVNLVSQNSGDETSTLPVVPGTISGRSVTVGGGGSGYSYTTIGVVHAPSPAVTSSPTPTPPSKGPNGVDYLSVKGLVPTGLVLDGNDLFVDWLGPSASQIGEYNARTGAGIRSLHVFQDGEDIASSGAGLWVLDNDGRSGGLVEISPGSGAVVREITAPSYKLTGADALSATTKDVWIANSGPPASGQPFHTINNSVTEVNAATGALVRVLTASSLDLNFPHNIEADGPYVWIVNTKSITELNSETGALIRVIRSPELTNPELVTSDVSDLWVTDNNGDPGQVDEFNSSTGALVRVIHDDVESPEGISDDGAHLWVSNDFSGTVTEYSNATGGLLRLIPHDIPGLTPQKIAANTSRIWVASAAGENDRIRVYGIPAS